MMTAADLEEMPQHQQDAISVWVLDMTKKLFAQPGVEEEYQKWLAERRVRMANAR